MLESSTPADNDPRSRQVRYVTRTSILQNLCGRARALGRLGMDLEFVRDRTYYPGLALVQLAVDNELVLVDPLSEIDLSALDELVLDPAVVKILHAPTQDLEIFYHRTRSEPRNVFDTQIAAALLGMGHQISYAAIVERVLDERVVSGEAYTDWFQRPLDARQERYALDDVRHLLPLHDALLGRLGELGRGDWAREECRRYEVGSLYVADLRTVYDRMKKGGPVNSTTEPILRALVAWREREAKRLNRFRRAVMRDEALVDIARLAPDSSRELRHLRGVSDRTTQRFGHGIIRAVRKGKEEPAAHSSAKPTRRPKPPRGRQTVDLLQSCVALRCAELEITPAIVATTQMLERLAADHHAGKLSSSESPLLRGWRHPVVGQELVALLKERVSVQAVHDVQPSILVEV